MKTVETYRGPRKIDVSKKIVENNNGEMVAYIKITPTSANGVQLFAYVHEDGKNATALTLSGHKAANELSDEQKKKNVLRQKLNALQNEQAL